MDTRQKIERWIKERRVSQTAAAKVLGIPQPTLSQYLKGDRQNLSAEAYRTLAISMGTTVDALLDPKVGWPLPSKEATAAVMTLNEDEREVLSIARMVSRADPNPAKLERAKLRMLELPVGPLQAAPPPTKGR